KDNFRWILGGFVLTFFSSFGQTYFIAASIAEWQAQFSLSHGEIGRLYMAATLASALSLPFVGRLVDVFSESRVVLIVIPALVFATLLASVAWSVTALFFAIFLLRLFGQGMMTHTALTTTGRWFSAARGRAVSLVVLGHQGGEASLLLFASVVTAAFGYKAGWLGAALMLALIALPIVWWAYSLPRTPANSSEAIDERPVAIRQWTRREVLGDPAFWLLLTGVLAPAFIGTTIFYHQDYLGQLYEWPLHFFPRALQLMAMTTIVVALISGWLIDRFGAFRILPFFLLPLATSCFLLSGVGGGQGLYLPVVILGISYGISSTLFGALWPETYGIRHLGAIRSVTMSAAVFATAAGPGLTGTLIDWGIPLPNQMRYLGFYCLVAMLAMTFVSVLLARRHRKVVSTPAV
ncbi:MAG: MFS transporter, partial [Woeseiaceae bacterium]